MKIPILLAALLLLAGCTSPSQERPTTVVSDSPTAVETQTQTQAPTQTPTQTPTALIPVVTTAGYGDLKLGKPVPSATSITWIPDWCTDLFGESIYGGGAWVVRPSGEYFNQPYYVALDGDERTDAISRLAIVSPDIETKSGAHTGMAVADLAKLFPNAEVVDLGKGLVLYVVRDHLGQVVFDTGPDDIFADEPTEPYVHYIHVLSADAEPYSAQYGDAGLGECSS